MINAFCIALTAAPNHFGFQHFLKKKLLSFFFDLRFLSITDKRHRLNSNIFSPRPSIKILNELRNIWQISDILVTLHYFRISCSLQRCLSTFCSNFSLVLIEWSFWHNYFLKSSLILLKCTQLQFMLSFKNSVECVKYLKPYLHTPQRDLNPRTSGPEAHTMTTLTKIFKNISWLPWLDILVSTTPAEIGTFGLLPT
jgi:hypothetical protein